MATPKNFINSVVFAKPAFSQADGLPRFYPTIDLQGGNIENVVLINGELPLTVPPSGGFVRYDACDGTIYDISVNLMNGASNIQLGYQAGDYGKGSRNVMIGYFAANGTETDLSDSVIIGTQSGVNADGSNNVYIGPYSGYYTGGSNNIFIGSNTGYDMSGINNNNIFLGRNVGQLLSDISDMFIVGDASDTLLKGYMKSHILDICGNLNVSDSINSYQYFKNGTLGINNSNPDNDYKIDVSGSAIVRGNLDICGNFYVSGNIIYDGSGVNVDVSNGGLTLLGTGTAQATLQVRDGGVTINNDGPSGAYMTIGYTGDYTRRDANHIIDCSGSIITQGDIDISSGSIILIDNDSTGGNGYILSNGLLFNYRYNSGNPLTNSVISSVKPYRGVDGDVTSLGTVINNRFYVNNNGQVALNKVPGYYLPGNANYYNFDVSGSIRSVTSNGLYGLTHTDSSVNIASYIQNTSGGFIGTTSNHPFHIYSNNNISNSSICVSQIGNVGINKTSPTESLDISGNLKVSNSIKALTGGSTISAPYYTFKMGGSGESIPSTGWTDITNLGDDIYTDSSDNILSFGTNVSDGTYTTPSTIAYGMYMLGFTVRTDDNDSTLGVRIYNKTKSSNISDSNGIWTTRDQDGRQNISYSTVQYLEGNHTIVLQGLCGSSGNSSTINYIEFWGYLLHSL